MRKLLEGGPERKMTESQMESQSQSNNLDQHAFGLPDSALLSLLSRWLLPSVILLFLAPFFALLFYSVPALDDYCKATLSFNTVPQRTVLSVTWMYYTQWSPRWLTTLLQSFVMSHVDLAGAYGWLLLAVILTNIAALWYFFRTVFRLTLSSSLLVAGVFYAAYVASLSDPAQQLFWVTGAIEYNLSFSTLLILMSLLLSERKDVLGFLAVVTLSFAVPAQHEIAGALLVAVLAAGLIIARVRKLPALLWYIGLLTAILSQIIVMVSPGNALRAAQEHRHLWDVAHFPRWVGHSFYHGLGWLFHPTIILAGFCSALLAQRDPDAQSTPSRTPRWFGIACICAMFAVCCEVAFVEIASGTWIPYRVVAWFQFVFWLLFICAILTGIPELQKMRLSSTARVGVFAVLAFLLFSSGNFRGAISDLRGPARIWWQASNSRLHQSGGVQEFPLPAQYPRMAMHQDLTSDSGCWVNRCLANYLHATSVVGKDSSDECPH